MKVELIYKIDIDGLYRGRPFVNPLFAAYFKGNIGLGETMIEAIKNCKF